ncbi:MAG: hypothetical protein EOP46_06480 [Sphingobacteriaceae bacterium]|nr:MAG: hypothetical protein EOP46_06480 [Sphingobacteriaceae bacterium]
MKKTLLLLLSAICALTAYAQKSVLFKMNYKPQHTYTSTIGMNMDMEMDFEGDSANLAKIKESGQKLPMLMQMQMDMTTVMLTAQSKDNSIPLTISYDKINSVVKMNGNMLPSPPSPLLNQKILGKVINDKLQFDSIPGKALKTAEKEAMTSMINNLISSIKFPEKPLTVGDTFTQDVPMALPIAGNNFDMKVKVIYKLMEIKNDIAYFDFDQSLLADMNTSENMLMHMSGKGAGKMEYSIKDSFYKNTTSTIDITYSMNIKEMIMKGKAKMNSIYSVDIKPSK